MGKYEPLGNFLRGQPTTEVRVSFAQIERIIGGKLPPSAHEHRAWWSNNPNNSAMTKAWIDAGFRSEQVDMEGRTLVFRRVGRSGKPPDRTISDAQDDDHPIVGCMKGTVTFAGGDLDLTEPADPEWGEHAWGGRK